MSAGRFARHKKETGSMKKHLLIAAAAAALLLPVLSSGAYAEPPKQEASAPWKLSDEDRAALVDARVAGLKAGLKLTAAQEKNWPAVETAIRDRAKARAARWAEWVEKRKEHEGHHDLIERLREHAKALEARAAQLTKFSEAIKPLYESLDEGQKRRLGALLRDAGGHHGHHFADGEGHGWGHGEGGPDHKG
jgi:zinc resistance-associated protein